MKRYVSLVVALIVVTAALVAQTVPDVKNPTAVTFVASADHTLIDSYELDFIRPDGSLLQTLNLGKPTPGTGNLCTAPINVQPVAFGKGYTAKLRAKAGTAVSDDVLSVNKFERAPGAPSTVTFK